jgi:hypothetical protein
VLKRISQREARQLRKRVAALEVAEERRRRVWSQEWTGGVNIATAVEDVATATAVRTARKLGHAVVVLGDDGNTVRFMALPHPKVEIE